MKILLMMTGGTICSMKQEDGCLASDTKAAVPLLVDHLHAGGYADVEFDTMPVLNILSENMTFARLNRLLDAFRSLDGKLDAYASIIIAHGTDTLAYTSSLLALTLAGWWDKPVFLVSSDGTLLDEKANGHANFHAAVELTKRGFGAGVYVPYRNVDGIVYIHHGAHLMQCPNFTADFQSLDMKPLEIAKPYEIQAKEPMLLQLSGLNACVMRIEPYVGIDYSLYRLPKSIRAVLHGSYHSATACAERCDAAQPFTKHSALYFTKKCRSRGIDVFLSPLRAEHRKSFDGLYSTTADFIRSGMQPIFSLTNETAYMKLALAYSLGYEREEVGLFLDRQVASEGLEY